MADPKIRIRRSATPNKVPETSQLQLGELAINTFDGKLYLEQDQTSGSGIATVIAVNPWNVGVGSLAYDTYFTAGNVGIGTTIPTSALTVSGLTSTNNLYVSGGSTFSQITVSGISPDGSDFGTNNYVPLADGSGGWSWQPVSAASGGGGGAITVREEGSTVGTANSISVLNFVGNNITANAVALGVAATITVSDTPTFDSLSVTGVSTLSSAIVGTSVTITSSGLNVTGVVTATSFVGDGSGLSNLPGASVGISTNTTDQSQLLTFATGYGSTTGLGATDGLVYNPSSGRLGIGSATPAYTLDTVGDINSSTDVKINGTGVLDTALALAIALG